MDIRDYEYIVAIAEQGSITRAAAQLFITQSALTKYLQRIEKSLGIGLFIRNGNQFLLTEAGQRYVETGRVIMHLDQQLADQLEKERLRHKSQIRLGYSMGRTGQLMKDVFPAFQERFPDVQIHGMADTSRRQMMALRNGELDFALVTNVERIPGYQYLPVEKSWMALAVRTDSPLAKLGKMEKDYPFPMVSRSAVQKLHLVTMSTATNSGRLAKEFRKKYGIEADISFELSDVRSLMEAVEAGLGAAMFMSVAVGSRPICYLSIEGTEAPEQTTELVFRSDMTMSAAMQYLIQLITNNSMKE